MCGIFGWITPGRPVGRELAAGSVNLMRHRGPDDEGYLFCRLDQRLAALAGGDETSGELKLPSWRSKEVLPDADAVLGFRRLSIHDLSAAGHQPMGTPDGQLWIVFNGEVYNFPELRSELEESGISFRSGTDTEVVLRAYEKWGMSCLERFNGMWGLAVLDLRPEAGPEIFLARDRCGVKPLFYHEDGSGGLIFASEMKSILATRGGWRPDPVAVGNFLVWGRLPSQRAGDTFVRKVRLLPPGCCATFREGTLRVERYWDVPEGGTAALPELEAVEKMRWLLEDSIKLRLRADVKIGSCLSGGLDSSVIVGQVEKLLSQQPGLTHTGETQHTFSAVYHSEGPYNEKRFIDRVLEGVKANGHYAWPEAARLVEDFEKLVWHQEEPFPTTSMFAQWCVMSVVKEAGVTVLLDGQASDELLAGYRPYQWHYQDLFKAGTPGRVLSARKTIFDETGDRTWQQLAAAGVTAALPDRLTQMAVKTAYLQSWRRRAQKVLNPRLAKPVESAVADPDRPESYPWRRLTESMEQHLRGLVQDFCLPHLLRYEDRNSMAFSIEARVPFTDFRIVEFAFSGALDGHKISHGWPKWVLREAGKGLVPADIIWRRDKVGFGTPETDYVRALAQSWINGGRKFERSAGWVRTAEADAIIHRTAAGTTRNRTEEGMALRLMGVETWLQAYQLNPAPEV